MTDASQPHGPDFRDGLPDSTLADGAMLAGHVGPDAVLIARRGNEVFAIDATCTHYGGPLGEGLMVGDTVRCPWHHACFSLRTGEALAAPAFAPVHCWRVERRDGRIFVRERLPEPMRSGARPASSERIVIIGGGAAGFAATEMLYREGFGGALTLISADESVPYDRPNLSKDYLAGTAPEEWIPLRPRRFYAENGIDLRLDTEAADIDLEQRKVKLTSGGAVAFTKLLIATGAEPIRLKCPGADLPHVQTLRSLTDCRAIISRAKPGSRAVIVGASFIGLEAAAALRQRKVEIHVVAPEARPMERVLGPVMGDFIRSLHESHGVVFHLGGTVSAIEEHRVRLADGARIDADLVLVGIGVRPRLALAEKAGLAVEHGVLVNEYLETSAPDVFAAGDITRWPDPHSGERLRIEHWVVAARQGQTAARNMLGYRDRFAAVPFFWTQQYDVSIDYVGHAAAWDSIEQQGDPGSRDVLLRFRKDGRTLAVSTIFRGRESLEAELAMEHERSP
ncbi:MAG TPA: FAD-dependent oxidoreductase [Steroidobacteraceae bacterium]|nr:FAD-dependent oxidoreductase [Steroidobacteraceae bacterium]